MTIASSAGHFYLCVLLFFGVQSFFPSSHFIAYAAPFRSHGKTALIPRNLGNQPGGRNTSLETSHLPLALAGKQARDHESPLFLNAIVIVAAGNLMLNMARPEPLIIWQFRFPRMLWEICIMVTATITNASPSKSPTLYLLLTFMLGTTALVDIFVWAPIFAIWAGVDNQDCTGGFFSGRPYACRPNRTKGWGRLVVTIQSLFGGIFYLSSAISAWGEYTIQRDRLFVAHQAHFLQYRQPSDNSKSAAPANSRYR